MKYMKGAHKNIQPPYIFPYAESPYHKGKKPSHAERQRETGDRRKQETGVGEGGETRGREEGKEGRRKDRGRRPFAAAQRGRKEKPTRDHESIDCSVFAISSLSGPGNESPVTFGIMR